MSTLTPPFAPFACPQCSDVFTRRENLARHQRSRHSKTLGEAKKKPRKLHDQTGQSTASPERHQAETDGSPLGQVHNTIDPDFTNDVNSMQTEAQSATIIDPDIANGSDELLYPQPCPRASLYSRYDIPPRVAASDVAAYFAHFHAFMPVIHRPSFSLYTSQEMLVSVVIAIGSMYAPSKDRSATRQKSHRMWSDGIKSLRIHMQKTSVPFQEPWVLQGCVLHLVYGFYFADSNASNSSWSLLQALVRDLRSLGLMNEQLTLVANSVKPWAARVQGSAAWTLDDMSKCWTDFSSQEAFRLCVWALGMISQHVAATCNTRAIIPATELSWELPPSSDIWEAPTADEWLLTVQEQIQAGLLTLPGQPSRGPDISSLSSVTQALMTASPSVYLLNRLSACPFATICVLFNIEALTRDFTSAYYQMPPVLPDPSAYHALAPEQNRPINAAINAVLGISTHTKVNREQINRLLQLGCWSARLCLSEPDDLLISGIVDNAVTAGLATTAHLILGSTVATRRAVTSIRRRFGDDASITAWDDMLKSLSMMIEAKNSRGSQPPWMTVLEFRLVTVLWRTLRKAIGELESRNLHENGAGLHALSPAAVMSSLMIERTKQHFGEGREMPGYEDLRGFEAAFISSIGSVFDAVTTPVGEAASGILREICDLLVAGTTI
ncbi:specific RNA polymerase II transcription factor [Lecanosticta acicola]|uniref:Specific RNA polymerase II transcription factor n=1 Tax=Lecanosticta acicola TaxID=111012 RepID=A0AAI8Z759_9PEZI|nr:specific RNA polymerase II transcription factor [Lecanosticta acicola]